jgi:DNA-binding SARP family transcriptional activator
MGAAARLFLVHGFDLRIDDESIPLSGAHQRLIAYLGLNRGPILRGRLAAAIWPERTDARAAANLRSLLFRLPDQHRWVVDVTADRIALRDDVACDVHDFVGYAHRLLDRRGAPDLPDLHLDMVSLTHDLLPGWYDEWVLVERERLHQLRLHALDELCTRFSDAGRHGEAVEAGLASVRGESLRESGQRALICAYLAEGNTTQARQQYGRYAELLQIEMGLSPLPELENLVFGRSRSSDRTVVVTRL